MAKTATVTKVQKAPTPTAKPQAAATGKSGATLMQQYENAINSGVGKGTEGRPIENFKEGAQALWDQSSDMRSYADKLRGQERGHEKTMLSMEMSGKAKADNFSILKNLEGVKYQADAGVKTAGIGAKTQQSVARTQASTERYGADLQYKSSIAGYQSNKEIAAGEQAGQNYRSGLDLAGRLLTNQADNATAKQGQFFEYMGKKAQSQHQAPTTSNIRYWAG